MRDSFVFYRSFFDAIKHLPEENRLEAYEAIFELALNGNDTTEALTAIGKAIFTMAKPQIEANIKRYENGKKGGRKQSNNEPNTNQTETKVEPKANQTKTKEKPNQNQKLTKTEPNTNQTETEVEPNVNVNVNVNENVNANKEPPSIVSPLERGETSISKSGQKLLDQALKEPEIATLVDKGFLRELISYRSQIKHPLKTIRGIKGVLRDFADTAKATGKSFDELFEIMSEREWRTIKPEYLQNSRASPKSTDAFREQAVSAINEFAARAKELV